MAIPMLPDAGLGNPALHAMLSRQQQVRTAASPTPSPLPPTPTSAQPTGSNVSESTARMQQALESMRIAEAHNHLLQSGYASRKDADQIDVVKVQQCLRALEQRTDGGRTSVHDAVRDTKVEDLQLRLDGETVSVDQHDLARAALILEGERHRPSADVRDPMEAARDELASGGTFTRDTLDKALQDVRTPEPAAHLNAQGILKAWDEAHAAPGSPGSNPAFARLQLRLEIADQIDRLGHGHVSLLTDPTRRGSLWSFEDRLTQAIEQHPGMKGRGGEVAREVRAAIVDNALNQTPDPAKAAHLLSYALESQQAGSDSELYGDLLATDAAGITDPSVAGVAHRALREIRSDLGDARLSAPEKFKAVADRLARFTETELRERVADRVLQDPEVRELFAQLGDEMSSGSPHERLARTAHILESAQRVPALATALYRSELDGPCGLKSWGVQGVSSNDNSRDYYANLSRIYSALGGDRSLAGTELRAAVVQRLNSDGAVHTGAAGDRTGPRSAPHVTEWRNFDLERQPATPKWRLMRDIADASSTPQHLSREITREIGSTGARDKVDAPVSDAELAWSFHDLLHGR